MFWGARNHLVPTRWSYVGRPDAAAAGASQVRAMQGPRLSPAAPVCRAARLNSRPPRWTSRPAQPRFAGADCRGTATPEGSAGYARSAGFPEPIRRDSTVAAGCTEGRQREQAQAWSAPPGRAAGERRTGRRSPVCRTPASQPGDQGSAGAFRVVNSIHHAQGIAPVAVKRATRRGGVLEGGAGGGRCSKPARRCGHREAEVGRCSGATGLVKSPDRVAAYRRHLAGPLPVAPPPARLLAPGPLRHLRHPTSVLAFAVPRFCQRPRPATAASTGAKRSARTSRATVA